MSEKYPLERLITNDLYLAAFLLCAGCELAKLEHNGRRRVSFVVVGEDVQKLRQEYESGIVRLNVRSFKENLKTVRVAMTCGTGTEQRSAAYAPHIGRRTCSVQA